ncbi:TetR family transcriptional regulator, partial [Streptomyces sp. McG6]|nr:TetR family transcriptional regulator [Streptomyces sp. McG6]
GSPYEEGPLGSGAEIADAVVRIAFSGLRAQG